MEPLELTRVPEEVSNFPIEKEYGLPFLASLVHCKPFLCSCDALSFENLGPIRDRVLSTSSFTLGGTYCKSFIKSFYDELAQVHAFDLLFS